MASTNNNLEILKDILEKSHQPQLLDSHPWTRSLMVLQACTGNPELMKKSPGQRLVIVLGNYFTKMMPATPPRRGKRMDTHWGEFGILAAQYFAPLVYGEPVVESLREAWGHIDRSILLFVYGKPIEAVSESEKESYRLVGNESGIAPNSTLSDWHRKGLEHLVEMIQGRESYLSGILLKPSVIIPSGQTPHSGDRSQDHLKARKRRFVLILLGLLILGFLFYDGMMSWKIYRQAMLVRRDVTQIRGLINASDPLVKRVQLAGPALSTLRQDFEILKSETGQFFLLGTLLRWVPVYGEDLASGQTLMTMAEASLISAEITYRAITPLVKENNSSGITPTYLTEVLVQAQPQLIEADRQINIALAARNQLVTDRLTPNVRGLIINEIDPLITLIEDGLRAAEDFPRLMGATNEGPKSYLVLAQNEDELRPTGGFITAVGTLLVDKGRISDLNFVNSYDLEDWSKPYPVAPWQLQQYMDASVLVLRDTSWFTNFPTAALYAETLYSYVNDHGVDGVIAFDQQFLVEILEAAGPIILEGVEYPIDASNVIAYMRTVKTPTAADLASDINDPTGMSKVIFMKEIADALLGKLFAGDIQLEKLITALHHALNERHLLLKIDSQSITSLLARNHWDGAVRPETGDFLMVADTNIGFNKTSALVQTNLIYDVDLTKPASPLGSLSVVHTNTANPVICKQAAFKPNPPPGEEKYLLTDCYWNYIRVYKQGGAKLLEATPEYVPANWMIVKQDVPARVDNLNEEIEGVESFGTLQVVPGGESVVTGFNFSLPSSAIQLMSGASVYHLRVQKQPGTLAVPITIRLHLPNNATIKSAPAAAVVQNPNIIYQTNLRTDIELEVVFQVP